MTTNTPGTLLNTLLRTVFVIGAMATLALPARAQVTSAPAVAPAALVAQPAPKAAKLPAPTTDVDKATCAQAGCHPEVKDYKAVHGPVNVNACDACHKSTT